MISVRYVVLHHTGIADSHFDVMIESSPGGSLLTWRSPAWPIEKPTQLTRLGEHRRDYLTYEGPVSNNRGHVKRMAGGSCDVEVISEQRLILNFPDSELGPLLLQSTGADAWLATPHRMDEG